MALHARHDPHHAVFGREAEGRAHAGSVGAAEAREIHRTEGAEGRPPAAQRARSAARGETQTRPSVPEPKSQRFQGRGAIASAWRASAPGASRRCAGAGGARSASRWSCVCQACTSRDVAGASRPRKQAASPDRATTRRAGGRGERGARPAARACCGSERARPRASGQAISTVRPRARRASARRSMGSAGPVHFQSLVTWRILTARRVCGAGSVSSQSFTCFAKT